MNKYLPQMLEYACQKKNLFSIAIVTNSTIIPSDTLISVLKKYKNKCVIIISDYTNSIKKSKLSQIKEMLQNENINFRIMDYDWFERGEIKKENRTIAELKEEMENCWQKNCYTYCDGELYVCSRSLGIKKIFDPGIKDFVKIAHGNNNAEEILNLICREYIDACDYCHTNCKIKIPRGKQIE